MSHSDLYIQHVDGKGRGVFSKKFIPANTKIEIAPVIVFDATERKILEQTKLYNYIFEWGENGQECCVALGFVSMYNHASPSNCEYFMFYDIETIIIQTVRDIQPGEELTINYSADWNQFRPVWFMEK